MDREEREKIAEICITYANTKNMRTVAKKLRVSLFDVSRILKKHYLFTYSRTPVHILLKSKV